MRLFDFTQAEHFCRALPTYTPGVGQSLPGLYGNANAHLLREGTVEFDVHRVSVLNNVERWILYGASQYRRAFDMFTPSNAAWAQVTLYYASFYAANAILGMFGVWIHRYHWADVESGIAESGFTLGDFSAWIRDEKIYPLNTVRLLPRILKHKKAKEEFIKHDARHAADFLEQPTLSKALADASLAQLAHALTQVIYKLPWPEKDKLCKDPSGEATQTLHEAVL